MTVAIVAASMAEFGQRDDWLLESLRAAGEACLRNADINPEVVEHCYVSNTASGEFEGQTGVANALAAELGLVPAYTARVDQTSASGGAGIYVEQLRDPDAGIRHRDSQRWDGYRFEPVPER